VSARKSKTRLDIQLSVEEGCWLQEPVLQDLCEKVLQQAAGFIARHEGQKFAPEPVEISLLFTDDASIRAINHEWRKIDKPTNVLSFPAFPLRPGDKPGPMLGDIILADDTIRREAADLEKTFDEHLTHLLVHGFLHLFGYDHMNNADAERMESLETGILAELGLSDPYGDSSPL
jgi:probable rRNA maturation factor